MTQCNVYLIRSITVAAVFITNILGKKYISDLWIMKGKLVSVIKMYSLDNFRRADILKIEKYIYSFWRKNWFAHIQTVSDTFIIYIYMQNESIWDCLDVSKPIWIITLELIFLLVQMKKRKFLTQMIHCNRD